jgi:hypothetical protein
MSQMRTPTIVPSLPRLVDRIYAQIPRQLRGRLDIDIRADPYYLRTEIIATGKDGVPYASGPLEVTLDRGKFVDCKIPDWFISHMCSIPVDEDRLTGRLWDSLHEDMSDILIFQR